MAKVVKKYTLAFFLRWMWKWIEFIFGWTGNSEVKIQSVDLNWLRQEYNIIYLGSADLVRGDQVVHFIRKNKKIPGIVMKTNEKRTRILFKPDIEGAAYWGDHKEFKKIQILSKKTKKRYAAD